MNRVWSSVDHPIVDSNRGRAGLSLPIQARRLALMVTTYNEGDTLCTVEGQECTLAICHYTHGAMVCQIAEPFEEHRLAARKHARALSRKGYAPAPVCYAVRMLSGCCR